MNTFLENPLFYGLTNSWTVVTHGKALAKARPFIPCSSFWSLQGFFFFSTGPTLFPLRGITSIKITGLGDQLLLRVLSLPSSVARTHKHVPTSVWIIVEGYRVVSVTRSRRQHVNEGHNSFQAAPSFYTSSTLHLKSTFQSQIRAEAFLFL